MQPPFSHSAAPRVFVLSVAFATGLVASPARAEDPAAEQQAEAFPKEAIQERAFRMDYALAVRELRTAIDGCDGARCSASLKGALFRDIGARLPRNLDFAR